MVTCLACTNSVSRRMAMVLRSTFDIINIHIVSEISILIRVITDAIHLTNNMVGKCNVPKGKSKVENKKPRSN